jgi:acetyl esterase/lipase
MFAADNPQVVPLWPGPPPDETGDIGAETSILSPQLDRKQVEVTESTRLVSNVSTPTLTVYRPAHEHDTGTAILICPGGGYRNLCWQLEGEEFAAWLKYQGVLTRSPSPLIFSAVGSCVKNHGSAPTSWR